MDLLNLPSLNEVTDLNKLKSPFSIDIVGKIPGLENEKNRDYSYTIYPIAYDPATDVLLVAIEEESKEESENLKPCIHASSIK